MATKIKSYRAPVWKKGTNNEVFVSDSLEVIEAAEHGIIKGQMWEYCKKGSNYGLRIYHEKESSTQN